MILHEWFVQTNRNWSSPLLDVGVSLPCHLFCEHWIEEKEIQNSRLQGLPVSGNKQDLIERLQSSLLDDGDDLLDQVNTKALSSAFVWLTFSLSEPKSAGQ